jgi:hypothetical protein
MFNAPANYNKLQPRGAGSQQVFYKKQQDGGNFKTNVEE